MKKISQLLCAGFLLASIAACDGIEDTAVEVVSLPPAASATAVASFNPFTLTIPTTNILLLGDDGKLDLPLTGDAGVDTLLGVLNELDGYSTTSPITYTFAAGVDPSTLIAGDTVRLLQVSSAGPAATGLIREVTGAEFVVIPADPTASTIAIVPLVPLVAGATYVVALTDGIIGQDGVPVAASPTYLDTKQTTPFEGDDQQPLEPVRQLVNSYEGVSAAAGIDPASIVLSWMFPTIDTETVLQSVAAGVLGNPPSGALVVAPSGLNTSNVGGAGAADIFIGTLELPYYLGVPSAENPVAPLTEFWRGASGTSVSRFDPLPTLTEMQTIPVLMTVPTGTPPAGGFPITIFQHGITRNRSDMLALADGQAQAGRAVIAIDIPLHGITTTNPADPLFALSAAASPFPTDAERTLGLDFLGGGADPCNPEPDGIPDDSGAHFLNLASMLTARDNTRQASVDLFYLANSLGDLGALINTDDVGFVGFSLGGIVGTPFLALDSSVVGPATLAAAGGGIAGLLAGSVSFGPVVEGSLACVGIAAGSPDFLQFLLVAQTAVDAADPINHAVNAAANHNIHLMEIVGGNSSPSDTVVPNAVEGFPLSGTEPLIRAMGLVATGQSTTAGALDVAVRLISGNHGSFLDPSGDPAVTVEMQSETASFMASGGNALLINDPSVVLQP